ncbi:CHAT domain-containing protein [Pseudonocardia alaniniphila]|uniref:CHAT domain-containing protein n=2 Tax=Pseudonocardia alaniniphila TaxID=75291 RepID=A0ABS9TBB6_9PSEU|nr:CHAT domain-containing protein [Pseudonocardia alaniniphila]MCH6165802.1 CHAT domain-containing protein [Pseudonocardia alaniniphila]
MDHEDAAARDDLMRRATARIDSSAAGDATAVTDPEALADADRLLDLIGTPGGPDMRLQYLAGMVHWNRWSTMGEAGRRSGEIAELLLTPLYFVDRSLLPAQLTEQIDIHRSPGTGEAGRYLDCGFALASLAAELNRPVFYDPAVQILDAAVMASSGDDPQRFAYLSLLGEVLYRRHEAGGDSGDLERAVEASREACRLSPATGPDLVPQLILLGRCLALRAERSEDPAPLLEAVDVLQPALRDAEPADRDEVLGLAVFLLSVGAGRPQTDRAMDPGFAAEVVATARKALLAGTPDDPRHLVRTAHLGLALALGGDPTATGEAVRLLCDAIRGLSPAEDARLAALSTLRNTLLLDAVVPLDDEDFDLASAVAEETAAASGPDDPDHYMCLAVRAAALVRRWARGSDDGVRAILVEATRDLAAAAPSAAERSRILDSMALFEPPIAEEPGPDDTEHPLDRAENREMLDRAMTALRGSIAAEPVNRALLPMWLADLARMLRQRCDWRPELGIVDEAIDVHRRLLTLIELSPDRHDRCVDLAALLSTRSSLTGERKPLVEAVEILQGVLADAGLDPTTRARTRYLHSTTMVDLALALAEPGTAERAEAAVRAVIDAGEPPEAMPSSWHNLGVARRLRYERTGIGLSGAIDAARRAVTAGEGTPDGQGERLAHLAHLLGLDEQLDEALALARRALAEYPADHARMVGALGEILRMHHNRFGGASELDESIAILRAAVRAAGAPVSRSMRLMNLAAALRARYSHSADLDTLEAAIAAGREALLALPADHQAVLGLRNNLVVQLVEHYSRTREVSSLDEAIETGRTVVAATAPDHPALGIRLANLALAFAREFERTGERSALDEAIALERRAVELAPPGHPHRGMRLSNLAVSLFKLVEVSGTRRAGRDAVRAAREAVAATPDDHPGRGPRLLNLAIALSAVGRPSRSLLREASRVAEIAARLPTSPPSNRLGACRVWGRIAAALSHWDDAAAAFTEGVRLLPRVAPRNLTRADAEHQLAGIDGVHVDAAACAVQAGDAAGALTALEQGRGVLLTYALESRTELTDLHATAPELGVEVQQLIQELDAVGEPLPAEEDPAAVLDTRYALSGRWDATLRRIRAVPGFERFGAPPSIGDLLPAARLGPVITVNVSEFRCDALVATSGGVRVVALPWLAASDVADRTGAFLQALELVETGDLVQRMEGQAVVRATLAWLWDVIAGPVLDALGYTGSPRAGAPWPRVWWSPTGMLNFLPLHAAGHHDGHGRAVLDRVVSSYTPTLRALLHARSRPAAPDPALLAVALAETPDQQSLPATVSEAGALVRGPGRAVQLVDADARYDAVLSALADCGWAHFACHAVSDPLSPSDSRLLLYDRSLAVRDISKLRLQDAELAFLSACSTARGSAQLADEAIHIASAFQLAGYRHVVGTLWPVLDATAARLTQGFYDRHHRGESPAEALHAVVRELRAAQPLAPSAWAAHIHAGP